MTADAALLLIASVAAGALVGWHVRGQWRGNSPAAPDGSRGTEPTTPFVVEVIARFPSVMLRGPVDGFNVEVQGLIAPAAVAGPDDGIDPATGLSFGHPDDAPEGEQ